jgi:pimeloyl-ACP methyl ester carboxylesterase
VRVVEHATWIGFSLGGRLVAELALRDPRLVDRLVLLEPMLQLLPEDGLEAAERERHEETYATADEPAEALAAAIGFPTPRELLVEEAREHPTGAAGGRLRFRYSKSAAVAAWGEMTRPPVPPAEVPTLIVVGTESWVPVEEHLQRYRAVLGDRLRVERLADPALVAVECVPGDRACRARLRVTAVGRLGGALRSQPRRSRHPEPDRRRFWPLA